MDDRNLTQATASRLADALDILATNMRAAVAVRRTAPPDSDRYRLAEAHIAHLNELYMRLQRRMEIPAEIWRLQA